MSQDIQFIATTVAGITEHIKDLDVRRKIIGQANDYARVKNYPDDKTYWSDKQLDKYLNMLEKLSGSDEAKIPSALDQMSLDNKVETLVEAGVVEDITPDNSNPELSGIVEKVVNNMEEQKKYRDDLKCPFCGQMVYDNRQSKKGDKSPDFVCSTNDPAICGGHSGKWRKSWWLDNSDIPEAWGI
jgi:hypothetical protein